MAFAEDLSVFVADFGDDGTLDGTPVRGNYSAPGVGASLGQAEAAATEPQLELPTASLPTAPVGRTLVIPQGTFVVREHIPDGTGMSVLLLGAG